MDSGQNMKFKWLQKESFLKLSLGILIIDFFNFIFIFFGKQKREKELSFFNIGMHAKNSNKSDVFWVVDLEMMILRTGVSEILCRKFWSESRRCTLAYYYWLTSDDNMLYQHLIK